MMNDPPDPDVIEVSIFGSGIGESIAVHVGYGDWILVDSCVTTAGTVPAIDYLERIGVSLAKSVRMVVATHAHDDHFAGIARIMKASTSAFFVVPAAGSSEEYWALLELEDELPGYLRNGAVREYRAAFKAVEARGRDKSGNRYLRYAYQCRPMLELRTGGPLPVTVTALSPSDESLTRARKKLVSQFPSPGDSQRRRGLDPNEMAIALWVEVGNVALLLGADVLNGPRGCGWRSIDANFKPTKRASLLKVAHHGSPNAHYPQTWTNLLTATPTALIAPYVRNATPRPARADIQRIRSLTPNGYITAPMRERMTRDAREEASRLGPLAKNIRMPGSLVGQVRARTTGESSRWSISLAAPATNLSAIRG